MCCFYWVMCVCKRNRKKEIEEEVGEAGEGGRGAVGGGEAGEGGKAGEVERSRKRTEIAEEKNFGRKSQIIS